MSRIDRRASMREEFLARIQRFDSNLRRPTERQACEYRNQDH